MLLGGSRVRWKLTGQWSDLLGQRELRVVDAMCRRWGTVARLAHAADAVGLQRLLHCELHTQGRLPLELHTLTSSRCGPRPA